MQLQLRTLDDYVEAFESAYQTDGATDLKAFLPPAGDPLHRPVLRELIRIDLEFGWESNRARSLEDYRHDFPDLFDDPESLQEIAFEEYRLRRRAGQSPSPREYSLRYGIRTDGWPSAEDDPASCASVQVEELARTYRAFSLQLPQDNSVNLDDWQPPPGTQGHLVHLFRDLHLEDKHAAEQFADGLTEMPQAGEDFLGFRLLSELGRGAFGRVFLARQAALARRLVALKVAPDVGAESQALAQLQHTHIVPIYSVHRAGPLQAVCMPWCGTVTVADVLRDQQASNHRPRAGLDLVRLLPLKPRPRGIEAPAEVSPAVRGVLADLRYAEAVLWLGAKLAGALHHAHERGILHRDVKPANILLTDEGLPMLLDFNVAQDVKQRGASAALVGGTLPYMAPEQLAAFQGTPSALDARADVYALGIVLFELLTGRFPFFPVRLPAEGLDSAAGLQPILQQMLHERRQRPPCPRRYDPAISPATAAIIRHCLEPDPNRRYPSAQALQEDLERQLTHEPLRHTPEPSLRERLRKWRRRHPRLGVGLAVVGAVALMLLGLGFGWSMYAQQREHFARELRVDMRDNYRKAQFLLVNPSGSALDQQEGRAAAEMALARHKVLQADRWFQAPALLALSEAEQQAAQMEVEELRSLLNVESAEQTHDVLTEARKLAYMGRFSDAHRLLVPVVWKRPAEFRVLFLFGRCCEALGLNEEALIHYTACVALLPDFYGPYVNRGLVFYRLRRHADALADFDKVVELIPNRAETYLDRALANYQLGDYKGALADLTHALELGKPVTRLYFIRARVREKMGDKKGAERDMEEGLRRVPQDEPSWIARGLARMQKDPAGALADFDKALEYNPSSRAALMNKAHVFSEIQNKPDKARAVFEIVLKHHPDHAPALAGYAVVLARLRQREAAHKQIAAALKRDTRHLIRYQAGCVYALTLRQNPADADTALVYLRQGLNDQFVLRTIDGDKDLEPLRKKIAFKQLLRLAGMLRQQPAAPR